MANEEYETHLVGGRDVGRMGASVGTSLAIERLMGIHPEFPDDGPCMSKYTDLWINLTTLYRNVWSAFPTSADADAQAPDHLAKLITEDIRSILNVIEGAVGSKPTLRVYLSDYSEFPNKYVNVPTKVITTQLQIKREAQAIKTYRKAIVDIREQFEMDVNEKGIRGLGRAPESDICLITDYVMDLIITSVTSSSLTLLESHTGKLKRRAEWYTKLTHAKDQPQIPFIFLTVQIFGDGRVFRGVSKKLREKVIDLSKRKNWSAVTGREKVMLNLRQTRDTDLDDLSRRVYRLL